MQRRSENGEKRERERGQRILQSVIRVRGALIRLLRPVSCKLKWSILTFRLVHDIQLIDIHFVQPQFCNSLSTNSLFRNFWAITTYFLGLGPKNHLYNGRRLWEELVSRQVRLLRDGRIRSVPNRTRRFPTAGQFFESRTGERSRQATRGQCEHFSHEQKPLERERSCIP